MLICVAAPDAMEGFTLHKGGLKHVSFLLGFYIIFGTVIGEEADGKQ